MPDLSKILAKADLNLSAGRRKPFERCKMIDADGNIVEYNEKIKAAYQTEYRLPISDTIRNRLTNSHSVKLASYTVHYRSNLSRLEYEVDKSDYLKKLFEDIADEPLSYGIIITGFFIKWKDADVIVRCSYKTNGDRLYVISYKGDMVFDKRLDSPVIFDDSIRDDRNDK